MTQVLAIGPSAPKANRKNRNAANPAAFGVRL